MEVGGTAAERRVRWAEEKKSRGGGSRFLQRKEKDETGEGIRVRVRQKKRKNEEVKEAGERGGGCVLPVLSSSGAKVLSAFCRSDVGHSV